MLPASETFADDPISGVAASHDMRASSLCSAPALRSKSIVPSLVARRIAPNSTVRSQSCSTVYGAITDSGRSWSWVRQRTKSLSRGWVFSTSLKMSQLPTIPFGLVGFLFFSSKMRSTPRAVAAKMA